MMVKAATVSAFTRPRTDTPVSWLGGLTPAQFMKRHWQKKPLLVRNAFKDFKAPVSIQEVLDLCRRDDVQSRLVRTDRKGKWRLDHGPFEAPLPSMDTPRWTVLVQQVNTLLPNADRFLDAFRFIAEARLDDLMISVAGPEGGIGAHTDSYDVFLIQANGQRRWEIAADFDEALTPDVPLKILKRFKAEQTWVLNAGDLLYLPPNVAHRGTAMGPACMTWSVGFRAPGKTLLADEVWARHLETLGERQWSDPWLQATNNPAQIPEKLLKTLTDEVSRGLPTRACIVESVACVLSQPAPMAVFKRPRRPLTEQSFIERLGARPGAKGAQGPKGLTLRLAPATRILYAGDRIYANGDPLPQLRASSRKRLCELADHRELGPDRSRALASDPTAASVLYDMVLAGWIVYH